MKKETVDVAFYILRKVLVIQIFAIIFFLIFSLKNAREEIRELRRVIEMIQM
jgi:hypothetical protein